MKEQNDDLLLMVLNDGTYTELDGCFVLRCPATATDEEVEEALNLIRRDHLAYDSESGLVVLFGGAEAPDGFHVYEDIFWVDWLTGRQ